MEFAGGGGVISTLTGIFSNNFWDTFQQTSNLLFNFFKMATKRQRSPRPRRNLELYRTMEPRVGGSEYTFNRDLARIVCCLILGSVSQYFVSAVVVVRCQGNSPINVGAVNATESWKTYVHCWYCCKEFQKLYCLTKWSTTHMGEEVLLLVRR